MASSLKVAAMLLCLYVSQTVTQVPISFASHYGSHMVLPRAPRQPIVWGFADVTAIGHKIMVSVIDANDVADSTELFILPDDTGRGIWQATLTPTAAGGPYRVRATILSTLESAELDDVYFGDIWLCAGQVNMEMRVQDTFNATNEMEAAYSYPNVRLFMQAQTLSETPQNDSTPFLTWSKPSPATVGGFSGVCWAYGRMVNEHMNIPIGLIQATWGSTRIEPWSSPEALQKCGKVPETKEPYDKASVLWNTMIHPLLKMPITGVIWYQGETNADRRETTYSCRFPAMIADWRKKFNEGTNGQTGLDLTFGFVQLGPDDPRSVIGGFPSLRWMQTAGYGYAPNRNMQKTFVAVTYDLRDRGRYNKRIPRDKTTVASRLVLGMRSQHLGERIEFQGLMPGAYNLDKNGTVLTLRYKNSAVLYVRGINGFEVCCEGGDISKHTVGYRSKQPCTEEDIRWRLAPMVKYDKHTVTLSTERCKEGQMIGHRYNWRSLPCEYKSCAIYTRGYDLPAPPYVKSEALINDNLWHGIRF